MTTKQMEYILELSATKNFNRAAENLFITQPALTYQIQKAEEELGFPLFVRSGKGAVLSAAGERFIATIERLLADYNRAVEEGRQISPQYQAAITIGLPMRTAVLQLAETIDIFAKEHSATPVMVSYYELGIASAMTLPEADIVLVPRDRINRLRREWREYCPAKAYEGEQSLPRTGEMVEGPVIWIPYAARPLELSFLLKVDEEREIIRDFARLFQQRVQEGVEG